jgi:hypothetical protein
MSKRIINLDTLNGKQNSDVKLGGILHCYNVEIPVLNPVRGCHSIELKSIEFPIQFYNIRASNGSNSFSVKFTYGTLSNYTFSVTIPEAKYTKATTLITALNTAITNALNALSNPPTYASPPTLSVSVAPTGKITIWTNATTMTIIPTILTSNILGFKNTDVLSSGTIISSNPYNLNIDHYVNLYIDNLNLQSENSSGLPSTFKLPLNATQGTVMYFNEGLGFIQERQINDKYLVINRINVIIYDRFGFPINGNGGDYSFSLQFNCD